MWTKAVAPWSLPLQARVWRPRWACRDERGPVLSWAPSRAFGWLEVTGAVLVSLATVRLDGLGQLLTLPAAMLLAGLGSRDLRVRPTLAADTAGLTVAMGLRHVTVAWADVERLLVVTDRRAPLLEIDLGDTVVVLPRRRLGVAPYLVLEELERLRP